MVDLLLTQSVSCASWKRFYVLRSSEGLAPHRRHAPLAPWQKALKPGAVNSTSMSIRQSVAWPLRLLDVGIGLFLEETSKRQQKLTATANNNHPLE
eukprot:5113653-Amphidinium_carterae.1